MASPREPEVRFVDAPAAVPGALAALDGGTVGVDVERADADRYFRRAALVQVGVAGRCVLLDAVSMDRLPDLDRFLADGRLAVFHALENDLGPLQDHGVRAPAVADTAVAAGVLGLPTGLRPLLGDLLDIELGDDKAAYQRADWEARPLSEGMAAYAAGDVVHLPALWAVLAERLTGTERLGWYEEELADLRRRASERRRHWTDVKGAGGLDPAGRAVLRALWETREDLARTHDVAPNRLLHEDVLRDLAEDPPADVDALVARSPRRRAALREYATDLFDAVERGRTAPPESRSTGRATDDDRRVFDALRRRRTEVARATGLDVGLLCPSRPLWQAVHGAPEDGAQLCELAGLNRWRTTLLAEPLWDAYVTTRTSSPPDDAPGSTAD